MSSTLRTLRRGMGRGAVVVAGAGAAGVAVSTMAAGPALAATAGAPQVNDRESVQVVADSAGKVDTARLFSQLVVTGDGKLVVSDPTSTRNLRNLDGFAAPKVENGHAVWDIDVHGQSNRRTVADFDQSRLPVTVHAAYTLDGKPIAAKDVVGKSGVLAATYTVTNVSAVPQQITYKDGNGKTVTKTVDVVMPLVGQLSTTLPSSFKDVAAPRADIAGDGKGGNVMNWTMVLFSPIGATTQSFGYTAHVHNASLPEVDAQVVPVPPQRKPELKYGEDGLESGSVTAAQVTFAGGAISDNLGKLADGAGQLLDGLQKLYAGANQLKAGLAPAASGAQQLADGLKPAVSGSKQLADGLGAAVSGSKQVSDGAATLSGGLHDANSGAADGFSQLSTGVDKLLAGAGQLDTGFYDPTGANSDLVTGSQDLSGSLALFLAGVKQLAAGLGQFAGADGLQKSMTDGATQLKAGIDAGLNVVLGSNSGLAKGVGTLLGAANHVPDATNPTPGALQAVECLQAVLSSVKSGTAVPPSCGAVPPLSGLDAVTVNVSTVIGALTAEQTVLAGKITSTSLTVAQLLASGFNVSSLADPAERVYAQTVIDLQNNAITPLTGDATKVGTTAAVVASVLGQLATFQNNIVAPAHVADPENDYSNTLIGGLNQLKVGFGQAKSALSTNIATGVDQYVDAVVGGVQQLFGSTGAIGGGASLLAGNADALNAGAADLADGIATAGDGASQIHAGVAQAKAGVKDFQSQLMSGLGQLDTGGSQLAAGSKQLSDGLPAAASGAKQLADGLPAAQSGAQQLAAGLPTAVDGAGQIADGLKAAKAGGAQIADGAKQLDAQAAVPLKTSANQSAVEYAEGYAMLKAMDTRAEDGGLPYGAPQGASGSAAYTFVLAAATHDSSDNAKRGGAAIALLGVTSLGGWALRRRFTH